MYVELVKTKAIYKIDTSALAKNKVQDLKNELRKMDNYVGVNGCGNIVMHAEFEIKKEEDYEAIKSQIESIVTNYAKK